jgi:hypothetical protein
MSVPDIGVADTLPAFLRLVVAGDGHFWVEDHATASELLNGEVLDAPASRCATLAAENSLVPY